MNMSEPTILSRHYGKLFLAAVVLAVICIMAFGLSANRPHLRAGPGAGSSSGSDIIGQLTGLLTAITALLGAIGKFQDAKLNKENGGGKDGGMKPDTGGRYSDGTSPVYYRAKRKEVIIGSDGPWLDIDLYEWDGTDWIRIDQYRKHERQPKPRYLD